MKEKELLSSEEEQASEGVPTLASMLAELSFHLHYDIPETILLAKYNELKKLVTAHLKAKSNTRDYE